MFASPSAEQMLDVTRAVNGGAGVLYIYGNYGGDVMNFGMAEARLRADRHVPNRCGRQRIQHPDRRVADSDR